jgi:predicted nucleic acid-binding protein
LAQEKAREKMRTLSLDTSVLISHLRGDRFAEETDSFLRRSIEDKTQLVIPDIVYAELYTGTFLASTRVEEAKVQSFGSPMLY